ncbi:MAG: hypothetical protein CMJ44_13675 [Pimelobacter sp.]|nr:hypothetical protein [Pimelobacter sp.]
MKKVAAELDILMGPYAIDVDVPLGSCAVAQTTDPFVMPPIGTACFVVLGDWLPSDAPIVMMVTYREYIPAGETESAREVGTVFANQTVRGHLNADGQTVAVAIGKWLFGSGFLTLHSPDRTDAGERWACAVGGRRPPRDQVGTDAAAVESGQMALDRLNQEPWPSPPWPAG